MNCSEARDRMLTAEPAELRGAGALGTHLAGCAPCARVAQAILAQDAALDHALRTLSQPAPRRMPRAVAFIPLAAAAVLALLVWRGQASYQPIVIPEDEVPRQTVVNSTGSSGVAVMQTRDPNITVVWNY